MLTHPPKSVTSTISGMQSLSLPLLACLVISSSAFSVVTQAPRTRPQHTSAVALAPLKSTSRSISRLAPVQMGLFGLGGPELVVIGVVALFLVGPDQIKVLAKDLGKMTPELKEVAAEAVEGFGEALKDVKESTAPALAEFKDVATEGLKDVSAVALKEAKEVARAAAEGAAEAEVPSGTAGASMTGADSKALEEKAVKAQE